MKIGFSLLLSRICGGDLLLVLLGHIAREKVGGCQNPCPLEKIYITKDKSDYEVHWIE